MDKSRSQTTLIISIILGVVLFVLLLSVSIGMGRYKKNFSNEMAQRLDLEEKILKMEKERQGLLDEIDSMKDKALESEKEIAQLKNSLAKEQEEKTALKGSLENLGNESKGPMQEQ
ncbi:MAG TPA: hypothetical protein PLU24_00580 [Candidatus Omnitrophota bacterium]|nr:hypothetical protein [Candidatus Omnitrophota bacterium]